jgi:hypothetical protein
LEVREYPTFCPKAIAGIRNLPDTLQSRAIPILLERKTADEHVEKLHRRVAADAASPLREALVAWAGQPTVAPRLTEALPRTAPAEGLSDRQDDIWEPLLAIADDAGGLWPERARTAATAIHTAAAELQDESLGVALLLDTWDVFARTGSDKIPTTDAVRGVIEHGERGPWPQWWERDVEHEHLKRPGQQFARLLRPFGIKPRKLRIAARTLQGYIRKEFEGPVRRYGTETAHSSSEPRNIGTPEVDAPAPSSDVPLFRPPGGNREPAPLDPQEENRRLQLVMDELGAKPIDPNPHFQREPP